MLGAQKRWGAQEKQGALQTRAGNFFGLNPDLSVTFKTTNVEHFVANFARKHIQKTIKQPQLKQMSW